MAPPSGKSRWRPDASFWTLVAANLVTVVLATVQRWELMTTLWIFWGQSVSIGVVTIVRLLMGETKDEYGRGILDALARFAENSISVIVFLLHYGGFHLVYFLLLRDFFGIPSVEERAWIIVGGGAFFLHHAFSFVYHRWLSASEKTRAIHPYTRILPLHLTLVLFPLVQNAVVLFLVIRAVVDLAVHSSEHRLLKS